MRELPTPERELVRAMLAGEEQAFNEFFQRYFPRIYRFALPRLGGDEDAAKEVVQATLVKAILNLSGFRGDAALFTWMRQICRRQVVDHLRAARRHSDRVARIDDSKELRAAMESAAASADHQPLNQYDAAETRRLIQSILDGLPARYGEALEWKYMDGRSVDEIAQLLGVGKIAAQSLLARARTAFGAAIERVFGATAADVLASLHEDR